MSQHWLTESVNTHFSFTCVLVWGVWGTCISVLLCMSAQPQVSSPHFHFPQQLFAAYLGILHPASPPHSLPTPPRSAHCPMTSSHSLLGMNGLTSLISPSVAEFFSQPQLLWCNTSAIRPCFLHVSFPHTLNAFFLLH